MIYNKLKSIKLSQKNYIVKLYNNYVFNGPAVKPVNRNKLSATNRDHGGLSPLDHKYKNSNVKPL